MPTRRARRVLLTLVLCSPVVPGKLAGTGGVAAAPRAQELAFVSAREGATHISLIVVDGSRERRLTPLPGGFATPAWSPDGRWIAFVSIRGSDLALWVMRPDGTGQRRLGPIWGDLSLLPLFAWRPQ